MSNIESDGVQQAANTRTPLTPEIIRRTLQPETRPDTEPTVVGGAERVVPHRKRSVSWRGSDRLPRILMVEDNWDHAYLALKALTADGRYQVELVASGAEALYKLNSGEFALGLLDYCLSGMNGLQLIRKIKELGQDIPIVMITGLGSEAVAVEAMKMGAYDYVVKSGGYLATLPMIIDKALERYELKKVKEQWDHWVLKRNRELGAISELGSVINQSLDPTTVMAAAVEKVTEILAADYGKIYLADELRLSAESGSLGAADRVPSADSETGIRVSSIILQVAESGEPVVLENVTPDPADPLSEQTQGIRSSIYAPLRVKQQMLGVLVIGSRKRLHYTSQDMMFYMAIANQIAVAVENAQLYEALRIQALRLHESEAKYSTLLQTGGESNAHKRESKTWSLQTSV